jgi:hypothetical protein
MQRVADRGYGRTTHDTRSSPELEPEPRLISLNLNAPRSIRLHLQQIDAFLGNAYRF